MVGVGREQNKTKATRLCLPVTRPKVFVTCDDKYLLTLDRIAQVWSDPHRAGRVMASFILDQ